MWTSGCSGRCSIWIRCDGCIGWAVRKPPEQREAPLHYDPPLHKYLTLDT